MNFGCIESMAATMNSCMDSGEDRWLCTLLLQEGFRIEYCANSDSYTNAPVSFAGFFNQRRRWVPSTMINIMDLLYNYLLSNHLNSMLF